MTASLVSHLSVPGHWGILSKDTNSDTILNNGAIKILTQMRTEAASVRFADLKHVCELYFGEPRQGSGSHVVFRVPWPGDPRVVIQNHQGKAKVYQVRQVLAAIDKLGVQ